MSVTEQERTALAKKIGSSCAIIATALVKLYLASPDPQARPEDDPILGSFPGLKQSEWTYTQIMGFLVLVSDHEKDALYLRIYDFKKLQRKFEYEIYFDMEYRLLDAQFHAFEMESCLAGLSFSVKSDAMTFHHKISALRPSKKDSAATILRKIRNETLAKDEASFGLSNNYSPDTKAPEPPPTFVNCTPEQVKMLKEYQDARKKYEEDMARYKAEQEALEKYEREKRAYEEKHRAYLEWVSEASGSSMSSHSSFAMQLTSSSTSS